MLLDKPLGIEWWGRDDDRTVMMLAAEMGDVKVGQSRPRNLSLMTMRPVSIGFLYLIWTATAYMRQGGD